MLVDIFLCHFLIVLNFTLFRSLFCISKTRVYNNLISLVLFQIVFKKNTRENVHKHWLYSLQMTFPKAFPTFNQLKHETYCKSLQH